MVKDREAELQAVTQGKVAKGHKLGPFASLPFEQFKCSPISFVPKRDSTKVQLIHNLSHPFHGNSINALIMVRPAGPAAELGKFDLTDA